MGGLTGRHLEPPVSLPDNLAVYPKTEQRPVTVGNDLVCPGAAESDRYLRRPIYSHPIVLISSAP